MSRKVIIILIMVLAVYGLMETFHPGGLMAYVFPSACWVLLALATVWACGFKTLRSWFDRRVTIVAALVAIFYIIIYMDIGLFTGFGRSPLSFTPKSLVINFILVSSTLLGMEFSRAYIVKSLGGKRPFLAIGLVTLLYSFINVSVIGLLSFRDPLALSRFMGTGLLPIIAVNLLATYLALIGGPIASLAYRAPLLAITWFSPILPDLSWGIESLLGVMVPTMSFLAINWFIPPRTLMKSGILTQAKGFGRHKGSSMKGWMIASVLCVLAVWASTGLFGIQPTTVISGSMRPTMDVGDMAIIRNVPADSIEVGDIIQYWNNGEMTIHRVVEVSGEGNGKLFVTKGDASSTLDPAPVYPSQVRGVVVLNIPKIGWAAIAVKEFFSGAWSLISANLALTVLAVTSGVFIFYMFRSHRNRSFRRWRGSRWGRKGLRDQKLIVPISSMLILLAITGFAYSHWSETLYISGTVKMAHRHTIIDSYRVSSPWDDELITSELSADNRKLTITTDNVFSSWYVWVGLKIHNTGTIPVWVLTPTCEFVPDNAEDNFEIETYFYGPYSHGHEVPENVWQKAHYWNLPADDNREPPVPADPCQHAIVWIKLHATDNIGAIEIDITVVDET